MSSDRDEKKLSEKSAPATRGRVQYLGFVVDPAGPIPDCLSHLLVKLKEEPHAWYVIEPTPHNAPKSANVEAGLRRYIGTLFFLAIRAVRQFHLAGTMARHDVLLSKEEAVHSQIGSYLRGVNRTDKLKSVSPDFPMLRLAIENSVFAPSGARPPLAIRWNADSSPDQIFFFWTPDELPRRLPNSVRRDGDDGRLRIVPASVFAPTTQALTPHSLGLLAEDILALHSGYSWQNLYRRALVNSIQGEDFITLAAHEVSADGITEVSSSDKQGTIRQARPLAVINDALNLLTRSGSVALLGPAGSGKSTVLKHLAARIASRDSLGPEGEPLPLCIQLKHFTGPEQTLPQLGAMCVREVLQKNIKAAELLTLRNVRYNSANQEPRPTQQKMLDQIAEEVCHFIEHRDPDGPDLVFFLDGYNEVPSGLQYCIDVQIEQYVGRHAFVILTTRTLQGSRLGRWFSTYSLSSLGAAEIENYLAKKLSLDRIYKLRSWLDVPSVRQMLGLPFYLTRAAKVASSATHDDMPISRIRLLERFVQDSITRKATEGRSLPDGQSVVLLNALSTVALRQIRDVLDDHSLVGNELFDHPNMTASEQAFFLHFAETIGLMESIALSDGSLSIDYQFSHDLYRDYFVARALARLDSSSLIAIIRALAEYYSFDTCLYFVAGLLRQPEQIREFFNTLGTLDPALAIQSLSECPSASSAELAAVVEQYGEQAIFTNSDVLRESIVYCAARLSTDQLVSIYSRQRADSYLTTTLLMAIVANNDNQSLPILVSILKRYGPSGSMVGAFGELTSNDAFEFLVSEHRARPSEGWIHTALSLSRATVPVERLVQLAEDSPSPEGFLDRLSDAYYESPDKIAALVSHPNVLIANEAKKIMAKHPKQIENPLNCEVREMDDTSLESYVLDLCSMVKQGNAAAAAKLLEQIRINSNRTPHTRVFAVLEWCVYELAKYGPDPCKEELVQLACLTNAQFTPYILSILCSSELDLEAYFRDMHDKVRSAGAHNRTVLALGVLGEESVADELRTILFSLPTVEWAAKEPDTVSSIDPELLAPDLKLRMNYSSLLHQALLKLGLRAWMPELENCLRNRSDPEVNRFYEDTPGTHFMLRCELADSVEVLLALFDESIEFEHPIRTSILFLEHKPNWRRKAGEYVVDSVVQEFGLQIALLAERMRSHWELESADSRRNDSSLVASHIRDLRKITQRRWLRFFGGIPFEVRIEQQAD